MTSTTYRFYHMPFSNRLSDLRRLRGLTQEELAQLVGVTKTQVYRYEKGNAQPTLEVIKKIAIALSVTTDQLIFEEDERQPDDNLALLMEGVKQLNPDEKHVIREMIEGMLVKHRTKQIVNSLNR